MHLTLENGESVGFVYRDFVPWVLIFKFWGTIPWGCRRKELRVRGKGLLKLLVNPRASGQSKEY